MATTRAADPARLVLGGATSLLLAVVGALVLGEYEFRGVFPFVAGVLSGLLVGEVVVTLTRRRGWAVGAWSASVTAGGLAWAARIDSNHGVEPFPELAWVAMGLGAAAALLRCVGPRRAERQRS